MQSHPDWWFASVRESDASMLEQHDEVGSDAGSAQQAWSGAADSAHPSSLGRAPVRRTAAMPTTMSEYLSIYSTICQSTAKRNRNHLSSS